MTVRKSLLVSVAAAALTIGFGAGSAKAVTVAETITLGINNISDDDAETWLDVNESGFLDDGDVLTGIIDWGTKSPGGFTYGVGSVCATCASEFSGVFAAEVTNVIDLGDGISGFEFGPYEGFGALWDLDALPVGSMVALFDDPTPDLDRAEDAFGSADATDGSLVWVWGFGGDPDEQWTAIGADIPEGAPEGTPIADYAFQLSSLYSTLFGPGLTLGTVNVGCSGTTYEPEDAGKQLPCIGAPGDNQIQINGGGEVVGAEEISDWPIYSDSNAAFRVVAQVPEPGTLALLGAGLLGLGWLRRRKART